ncbi:hypothetical protein NPIL_333211 [Nephila pilipes]|uniref:Uncharacterized protein n=1 Tax=Nephila pilipes TaxID=299642 RepID=A0A8X6NJQ2_NEPPI|nr:hypothetical protein NPIL_333211 [Nephila pilipes]
MGGKGREGGEQLFSWEFGFLHYQRSMESDKTSFGGIISTSSTDNNLLELYQRRFDESQWKDDKYKEKIDRHLKELVADRHELEIEVLRRGEKISNLQKALIDLQLSLFDERERFINVTVEKKMLKKSYEKLREGTRSLLNLTKDIQLRDQIINILQHSKVKVDVGYGPKAAGSSVSKSDLRQSRLELLKEQIQLLLKKITEYSQVSKSKTDVIVKDCKLALEKSRRILQQNEQEINFLKMKLQEADDEVSKVKQAHFDQLGSHQIDKNITTKKYSSSSKPSSSDKGCESKTNISADAIRSCVTDMHLSLVMLSKVLDKVSYLLDKIQATQIFLEVAKLPKSRNYQAYVEKLDINQLQTCIRQCTRLSFDISNLCKALNSFFSEKTTAIYSNLEFEVKNLIPLVEELAVSTADTDLLFVSVSRETFFDYLIRPKHLFDKFRSKETSNYAKYVFDVYKMVATVKSSKHFINQAEKFVENIIQKCDGLTYVKLDEKNYSLSNDSTLVKNLKSTQGAKIPHLTEQSRSYFCEKPSSSWGLSTSELHQTNKVVRHKEIRLDIVNKCINEALEKINELESGEHYKDIVFFKHLLEKISLLAEQLNELFAESIMKNEEEQFSEYSSLTFKKLEMLAEHSRDAVSSAEAQITDLQDNARILSKKLSEAEELVRESINECLVLKQKLQLAQLHRKIDKANFGGESYERLYKLSDFELETAVKKGVHQDTYTNNELKVSGPYNCLYCKQGSHHKLCIEKIKELTANNRKLSTELKHLQQKMKEEKKLSKVNQEQAVRATHDIGTQKQDFKKTLVSLESKNTSLLEQLKLERNRFKNLERFRRLEIEGFQTDIKNLKAKILDLEKQLMKAVLIFENNKKDQELLKTIHTTAQHTKRATGAISEVPEKTKTALFRHLCGEELKKRLRTFDLKPNDGCEGVTLQQVLQEFDKYFLYYQNEIFVSFKFLEIKQGQGEKFTDYYSRLHNAVVECNYGETQDRMHAT